MSCDLDELSLCVCSLSKRLFDLNTIFKMPTLVLADSVRSIRTLCWLRIDLFLCLSLSLNLQFDAVKIKIISF